MATLALQRNLVYIRKGDVFHWLQSLHDLRKNWDRLLDAAGLTNSKLAPVPGTKL